MIAVRIPKDAGPLFLERWYDHVNHRYISKMGDEKNWELEWVCTDAEARACTDKHYPPGMEVAR